MAIQIVAKRDGFRRCGIEHVGTKVYPADKFTAAELKALKAEPMLAVAEVPDPAPAGEGKGKGK